MDILTSITILVLAAFVGFEVISKVPNTLHTPLMSGTNAIHGIVVLGGLLLIGPAHGWFNDLLLVMIITEVLRTVLSYLSERGSSLRPFLFIAAISATRRILAIGARMSLAQEQLEPSQFQQAMIDLSVNAAVILAIAIALYLLTRRAPEAPDE